MFKISGLQINRRVCLLCNKITISGLQSTATMPTSLATTASAGAGHSVPAISIDEIATGVQHLKVDRDVNEGKI